MMITALGLGFEPRKIGCDLIALQAVAVTCCATPALFAKSTSILIYVAIRTKYGCDLTVKTVACVPRIKAAWFRLCSLFSNYFLDYVHYSSGFHTE